MPLAELSHRKIKDAFDGNQDANVVSGKSDKSGRQDGKEGEEDDDDDVDDDIYIMMKCVSVCNEKWSLPPGSLL